MKRNFALFAVIVTMLFSTAAPVFAASKLSRPVIDEIDAGNNSIKIDWGYVKHADEYDVYRATSKNGDFTYIASVDESWYRDYDIVKGKKYYYKVRALSYSDYENSSLSKWRSAKVNKPSKSASSGYTNSQTVYITNTGAKYHNAGCRSLRKSCIATTLSSARSSGYEACKLCW